MARLLLFDIDMTLIRTHGAGRGAVNTVLARLSGVEEATAGMRFDGRTDRAIFLEALGRHGVNRIEALGQPFDPNKHEAIAQVGSDVHPALHVADQHLIGYELHDRLLRPAMVSVSSGKPVTAVESTKDSD